MSLGHFRVLYFTIYGKIRSNVNYCLSPKFNFSQRKLKNTSPFEKKGMLSFGPPELIFFFFFWKISNFLENVASIKSSNTK